MNSIDVLYNLPGVELEASDAGVLEEVEGVCDALSQLGIEHRKVGLSREGFLDVWPLLTQDTLVFNLCEGLDGEAGFESLVAGVLELYHIPFTGSSSRTLGLCQDKAVTKALLSNAGVPCVPGWSFSHVPQAAQLAKLRYPVIVKPQREDGGLGVTRDSVVHSLRALRERLAWVIETFHQPALVESYVHGRELNVAIVNKGGNVMVLPPSEIQFQGNPEVALVTHDAKWKAGSKDDLETAVLCPATLSPVLKRQVERSCLAAWRVMGCRDYCRVDLRVTASGTPLVLEVNPNPDISRDAGLARSASVARLSYVRLIETILENAWKRNGMSDPSKPVT